MHRERMRQIGNVAIPREGTPEWYAMQRLIEKNRSNPAVQEHTRKTLREAVASFDLQKINGAGLPADILLRDYNIEYNNRVFHHSLHQLPSSFNIVEAFNTFDPRLAIFEVNKEIDCLFSFESFLDFVTSEDCPETFDDLSEYMKDGVIYSFSSFDAPEAVLFSTENHGKFGVRSISLIKHGQEVSVLMLAGQECDLKEKSKHLVDNMDIGTKPGYNGIGADTSLKVEAVPLQDGSSLWKTIIQTRFDLDSLTIDARAMYQDAGRFFTGYNDDIECYMGDDGEFISPDFEDGFKKIAGKIEDCTPLFELCKTALFLPVFRTEFEDTISVERHPTELGLKRNKPSLKKVLKVAKGHLKVSFRNVESIQPCNRIPPSRREFRAPDLKIETSGYWKKLDFQSKGEDKNQQPIQGRTWVNKTLEWREQQYKQAFVKAETTMTNKDNEGYIYVMRSAAHEKNVFKVGLTRRTSEERSAELSRTTSSIDHFHVMEEWDVSDCVLAEKIIHERLSDFRINPKREYFKAPYREIFKVIDSVIDSLQNGL